MKKNHDVSELVGLSQKGNRECLGVLSAHVRQRVFLYLYRMTLDYHLAQDLAQETVLYMIESLPRLNTTSSSSLWGWIYRSAWGIFQHYLRSQGHRRILQKTIVDHEVLLQLTDQTEEGALEQAEQSELFEAICKSLGTLETRHRNVLILRCFELLSYAEIASVMGGSELKARVLFFHAKHALKRRLHNCGYGREYFLTSLSLFAAVTGMRAKSASAAVTVTSDLLKTGTMATLIGSVSTDWGLIAAAVIVIGLVAGMFHVRSLDGNAPIKNTQQTTLALQGDTRWASPLRIISSNGLEENVWEAVPAENDEETLTTSPLDLQATFARQWYKYPFIIPEGHWIEFGFGGAISNGIGFDVRCDCLDTGNFPDVFLTDGRGRTLQLTNPVIESLEERMQRVSFDLTDVEIPFEPVGVRVQGRGLEGPWKASVLISLQAQISLHPKDKPRL
jgi:RNA polymerase sigma-70 factor (ECF subfamily)